MRGSLILIVVYRDGDGWLQLNTYFEFFKTATRGLQEQKEQDMRYSQMLIPTVKEIPADAEATSHKLMIRAGLC
ncbi:MAG: hypothetical protein ACYSWW_28015, partial [Planctomycetota bacterium]